MMPDPCPGCPECHVSHDCDLCGVQHTRWSNAMADLHDREQRIEAFGLDAELLFGRIELLCEGVPDDVLDLVLERLDLWAYERRHALAEKIYGPDPARPYDEDER